MRQDGRAAPQTGGALQIYRNPISFENLGRDLRGDCPSNPTARPAPPSDAIAHAKHDGMHDDGAQGGISARPFDSAHPSGFASGIVYLDSVLNRPPVIGFFLVIHMPHASDMRRMAVAFRPVDRFMLGFESAKHVVHMVLDDIVLDGAAARAAFGPRFYVYVCHGHLLPPLTIAD
jgi:hypothetical protein